MGVLALDGGGCFLFLISFSWMTFVLFGRIRVEDVIVNHDYY